MSLLRGRYCTHIITPHARTRGKVIGLSFCRRRHRHRCCYPQKNGKSQDIAVMASSTGYQTVRNVKKKNPFFASKCYTRTTKARNRAFSIGHAY